MIASARLLRLLLVLALATVPVAGVAREKKPADTHKGEQSGNPSQQKAQAAQAGAGTRDSTTTGSSGPKKKGGGGKPSLPQASLCQNYQGAVQQDCLVTVLRGQAAQPQTRPQSGGAAGSQPQATPKANRPTGNNNGG
jgi:hypothetical protein